MHARASRTGWARRPTGQKAAIAVGAIVAVFAAVGGATSHDQSAVTTAPTATARVTAADDRSAAAATGAAAPVVSSTATRHAASAVPSAGATGGGVMPNPSLTPGAAFPDVTAAQVCVAGYSSRVRSVSTAEKNAVYAAYGLQPQPAGSYELDHLIALELGGDNLPANLWPQPAPGFHQKDALENRLHSRVCTGTMTLAVAQHLIATNWYAAWVQYG